MLFYGSYLLPYNSEIKLVHIEEVELQSAVIDFPLRGRVDTSEPRPKKTRAESGVRPGKGSTIREGGGGAGGGGGGGGVFRYLVKSFNITV